MRYFHTILYAMLFLFISVMSSIAAEPNDLLQASPEDMQWFREAKFGLFIHWGPVSLQGTEIGWSRGGERRYPKGKGEVPVEVYDNLYKQFNPTEFDAEEWVQIAQDAGMKYLVFTTKHHDGFCMFDSQTTDYKITRSPFGRDVTKEIADACHKAGLKLGFYYSPPDWRNPDYFADTHSRYIAYMHSHVEELCTRYGSLDVLWFDGLGAPPERWDAHTLIPKIRQWQPGIVINNRAGLPADYDTPEQEVGRFQNNRAWESCITMGTQWAWKPNDTLKSLKECIDILVRCAGGDGNLLFNVGPMPNGKIEERQVERLKEIGAWLKQYGESIYYTRGGPFLPGEWGASTYKGNTVYLHILKDPQKPGEIKLPSIPNKIISFQSLTNGEEKIQQTESGIQVNYKPNDPNTVDFVIKMEVDSPAEKLTPIEVK